MTSQLCRTLQMKGRDRNYMIAKFDNDTFIRFSARHDSFGLNFTRKNRKSEKNPAFQKSELGILPLNEHLKNFDKQKTKNQSLIQIMDHTAITLTVLQRFVTE